MKYIDQIRTLFNGFRHKTFAVIIALLLTGALWFSRPAPAQAQQSTPLPLPDLQTLPPFDLQLLVNQTTGKRLLRFSNSVANTGTGPLHVRGEMDPTNQTVTLIQEVRGANGAALTRRLGGFAYHPEHNHWHWQGFSEYEIWSLGLNAELEAVLVFSGKVGYCMLDSERTDPDWIASLGELAMIPIANRAYTQCGWRRQGISPGWMDTYLRNVPGQVMDVTDLADGVYALRSIVDPAGLLAEVDKSNNAAHIYFRLQGSRLQVLEDERFVRAAVIKQLFGETVDDDVFEGAGVARR